MSFWEICCWGEPGAGDEEGAAHWYALLARNWKAADPELPELAEVRAGAKRAQASR